MSDVLICQGSFEKKFDQITLEIALMFQRLCKLKQVPEMLAAWLKLNYD